MFNIASYIKNIKSENIRLIIVPVYFIFSMLFGLIPRMVKQGYGRRIFMKEFWFNNYAIFTVLLCGELRDK